MADILKIGAEFDVSNIVAGSAEASEAVQSLANSVAESSEAMAGTSARAATAMEKEAAAHIEAASAGRSHAEANLQARLTTDALTGNISRAENALIRFASHSEALGPIMQAAFAPLAVAIFADIVVHAAEKIYQLYENVILLKSSIEALDKTNEKEAETAARLNETYEEGIARRLEAEGKFVEAREAFKKAAEDKPLTLPQIDDKLFKQFNKDFVSFLQAVHTSADAPTVISRINAEAESTAKQLAEAQQRLKDLGDMGGEALAFGGVGELEHAQALVDDYTKKLDFLKGVIGQVQSQSGIAAVQLQAGLDAIDKKAEETSDHWRNMAIEASTWFATLRAEQEKQRDAATKLASEELEFFSKSQETEINKQIEVIQKRVDSEVKYQEDVTRMASETASKRISEEERAVSETAKLREMKEAPGVDSELGRAIVHQRINADIIAQERELENQRLAVEVDYQEKLKAILLGGQTEQSFVVNATPEQLTKLQSINSQIEALQNQHTAKMKSLDMELATDAQKTADAMERSFVKVLSPMNRAFESAFDEIIRGTVRAGEAFRRMGQSIVTTTLNSILQMGLKWAEHFIAVEIMEHSSIAQRLAAFISGEGVKKAVQLAAATTEVSEYAGEGAAAAYASVLAALPFPANVAAAPGVAATQLGAIMAIGLPKADTGAYVPRDMPLFAHAGEVILNPQASRDVGTMAKSFNEGGGGTSIAIHAMDSKSIAGFLHDNRAAFTKMVRTAVRNGQRFR